MFAGKAGAYPRVEHPSRPLFISTANIRLDGKYLLTRDKHPSLFGLSVRDEEKKVL